ncbi:MAG TPA: ABC transporter ATP-binding protein [Anaeromyxobacter sp.]|nr:ABC transporter ATP-binding protein [Anaeromyxobacter sp.]
MIPLLEVRDLGVEFDTYGGAVQAVRGVGFSVEPGKTLAIVGESGCGKSATVHALAGLVPSPPGRVTSGSVRFEGRQLLGMSTRELNRIRGKRMGVIFQDPMTSLNPTMPVGKQLTEALRFHEGLTGRPARHRAIELLERVRIADAGARADDYPFQFSGGMRQRVMIAMAIACGPALLLADEPTTALDVTVQAEILALLTELQRERGMAVVLITHDLGVVARVADDVAVMYAGRIVERGTVEDVFARSAHPYTLGLEAAMPHAGEGDRRPLVPIEGSPPDLFRPPAGCAYFDRCPWAMQVCESRDPPLLTVKTGHESRCWLHDARAHRPPELQADGQVEASS